MEDNTAKTKVKRSKLLLATSIIMLISSLFSLISTAFLLLYTVFISSLEEVSKNANMSSLTLGISFVFGFFLSVVSFYAALRGITQDKPQKCHKLGIVLILLFATSFLSNVLHQFTLEQDILNFIVQLIVYAALSLALPVFYLIGSNILLKKSDPPNKYTNVIKSI